MKNRFKTVVVTGAESTGKSVLTEKLASHFEAPYIPEFAREYVENLDRHYTYADVETIARRQIKQFNDFKQQEHLLFFADTWLIITKIWFEEVYNDLPAWIEDEIKKTEIDLFLVCDTDLPWVPDNVRENGGKRRRYLQKRYIDALKEYNFAYEIVSGADSSRLQNAVRSLEEHHIVKPNKA